MGLYEDYWGCIGVVVFSCMRFFGSPNPLKKDSVVIVAFGVGKSPSYRSKPDTVPLRRQLTGGW